MDFFTVKEVQDVLTNILFVWCKQNQDLGYRQGMHEIAAQLTYAAYAEVYETSDTSK